MTSPWQQLRLAHARGDPEVVLTHGEVADLLEHAPRPLAIDPAYEARAGFDIDFMAVQIPLPVLDPVIAADAAVPEGAAGDPVLRYHHFSVVLSRSRRLARWTAANLDGRRRYVIDRTGDSWAFDPRLPATAQVGEALYADNDLDRGHLVRRQDPIWGDTLEEALAANDDTFHFTNCAPQHSEFNQGPESWLGLEDYILNTVADQQLRAAVLTGPVFDEDDPVYRDVAIPLAFWKVVATVDDAASLHATAYVLRQDDLLGDIGSRLDETGPVFGPYRMFQVPVSDVEAITLLDLGPLRAADPLADEDQGPAAAGGRWREIHSYGDIALRSS
jgi:endonuclease G